MGSFRTGFGFTIGGVTALLVVAVIAAELLRPATEQSSSQPPQSPAARAVTSPHYPPAAIAGAGAVTCWNLHCTQRGRQVSFGVIGSGEGPAVDDACGRGRTWHNAGTVREPGQSNYGDVYACRAGSAF